MTDLLRDPAYAAILDRCRKEPADDLHRLALADRLEELADPYGDGLRHVPDLIRVSVEADARMVWDICRSGLSWVPQSFREILPKFSNGRPDNDLGGFEFLFFEPPDETDFVELALCRGLVERVYCRSRWFFQGGPALVRHPLACVTWVWLADKDPVPNRWIAAADGWIWTASDDPPEHLHGWELPRALYAHLPGDLLYSSEDAAFDALQAACLAWAWSVEPAAV